MPYVTQGAEDILEYTPPSYELAALPWPYNCTMTTVTLWLHHDPITVPW